AWGASGGGGRPWIRGTLLTTSRGIYANRSGRRFLVGVVGCRPSVGDVGPARGLGARRSAGPPGATAHHHLRRLWGGVPRSRRRHCGAGICVTGRSGLWPRLAGAHGARHGPVTGRLLSGVSRRPARRWPPPGPVAGADGGLHRRASWASGCLLGPGLLAELRAESPPPPGGPTNARPQAGP